MSEIDWSWDDKNFKKALRLYLDLKKNVDPVKELKRRAKNIDIKLIKLYKDKGTSLAQITQEVRALGPRVKIRPKIRAKIFNDKKGKKNKVLVSSHQRMINAELNARRSAKGFTATGWFPSLKKLGGAPNRKVRDGTGPERGTIVEKLTGTNISETLINQQPGASVVMKKEQSGCQKVVDAETADLTKYNIRKLNEAARKAGLI